MLLVAGFVASGILTLSPPGSAPAPVPVLENAAVGPASPAHPSPSLPSAVAAPTPLAPSDGALRHNWSGSFAHLPASWGGATSPPGAFAARDRVDRSHRSSGATDPAISPSYGNQSHPNDPRGECHGIWPTYGGQSTYANDCYGHDEPGINFYSTLGGSGGNVSWNITLPVSRSFSETQSDLYTAIWFGMTLSDPYAWLDQCFLELQFYPDSDWNVGGPAFGSWVGAAVGWQIEASNGYEDACFYEPLLEGPAQANEFLMSDGDQISVTMTGWVGSLFGENLTLHDWTNGQVSYVTMYNGAQNYPINPAYTTSEDPNGLQWTPGGELPVVFAFETGHPAPPYPNNNSWGGCSSGVPPPTPSNPSVPCPSYDPGAWLNDTVVPWEIQVPVFFNATAAERPSQVSFTQDLGGISYIDPLSNYTCSGRDGSEFCSYPWYSFSCATNAFEYGATDYRATTEDFGGYLEFATNYATDAAGLGFVPPTNFSIPVCSGPSYNVTVGPTSGGAGTAYFLSTPLRSPTMFPAVAAGEYSLAALPARGQSFAGWSATGAVSVLDPADPSTTLWVAGDGSVTPAFSSTAPATVSLSIATSLSGGQVVISPSFFYTDGVPLAVLANGGSVAVAPGLYSIQAASPIGYNFSYWTVTGDGATVAAPQFPFTWLDVPAASGPITLTMYSTSTASYATIYYSVFGSGSISFDGGPSVSSGSAVVSLGTYSLVATPPTGWAIGDWYCGSSGVMTDFRASTNVTLELGTTYVYAEFEPLVHFRTSPSGAGQISVNYAVPSPSADQSLYPSYYTIIAVPSAGYALSSWSVSSSTALWAYPSGGGTYTLEVNRSGTVTASFTTATAVDLTFATSPSVGGIRFNFEDYAPGAQNTTLTAGTYLVSALPAPGYNFTGWTTSGSISVAYGAFVTVTGSGGTLTADYALGRYPVTFTIDPPSGASVTIRPPLGLSSTLATGETIWLSGDQDLVTANLPAGLTLFGWSVSPGIGVTGSTLATIAVNGPGTLTAHFGGFALSASVSPATAIDLGMSITASALALGDGTFSYAWSGLPPGCPGGNVASFRCTPAAIGNYSISVTVLSSDGSNHSIAAGSVTVVPALVANSFVAAPTSFTVGGSTTLTASTFGGVVPLTYQYSGLPAICPGANLPTISCTPDAAGRIDVTVRINDSAGLVVFGYATLLIASLPTVLAFNESRSVTDVGLPVSWSVWVDGGTAPLHLAYIGLPPGCVSQDSPRLACTPTATGNYTIRATALDADGVSAESTRSLSVNPTPAVASFSATPASIEVNGSLHLVVVATGGTAPVHFVYRGLPTGCASRNATDWSCTPVAAGNFTIVVTATDALGVNANASAAVSVTEAAIPVLPSTGTPESLSPTVLLVALVAAIGVAAVALVLWRRRRDRNETEATSGVDGNESAPETFSAVEQDPPA